MQLWEERKLCLFTNWMLFVVWMLAIPYGGSTSVPPQAQFYASTGIAGFALVVNQASLEVVFSKKATEYADVVGDNMGKLLGIYFMAAAGEWRGDRCGWPQYLVRCCADSGLPHTEAEAAFQMAHVWQPINSLAFLPPPPSHPPHAPPAMQRGGSLGR